MECKENKGLFGNLNIMYSPCLAMTWNNSFIQIKTICCYKKILNTVMPALWKCMPFQPGFCILTFWLFLRFFKNFKDHIVIFICSLLAHHFFLPCPITLKGKLSRFTECCLCSSFLLPAFIGFAKLFFCNQALLIQCSLNSLQF